MSASLYEFPAYQSHWVSRTAFPLLSALLLLCLIVLGTAVHHGQFWLAIPLVLLASHCMHGQLIGFHEASHGLLRSNKTLNEIDGVLIGIFSFMSFTLYRAAHQTHHMHIGSERDEELWPFNNPRSPRCARIFAACIELTMGLFFTPFLFIRAFLRKGSPIRAARVRRRIWIEFVLVAAVWTVVITLVAVFGRWKYLFWLYLLPAWLAGNMQSLRKYIEHVGLTGSTLNSATRNVRADTWMGKLISVSLLHEPFHGVHHIHAGLHHHELPAHAELLEPHHPDEHAPFANYWQALLHLARSLPDPRVGSQWQAVAASTAHS